MTTPPWVSSLPLLDAAAIKALRAGAREHMREEVSEADPDEREDLREEFREVRAWLAELRPGQPWPDPPRHLTPWDLRLFAESADPRSGDALEPLVAHLEAAEADERRRREEARRAAEEERARARAEFEKKVAETNRLSEAVEAELRRLEARVSEREANIAATCPGGSNSTLGRPALQGLQGRGGGDRRALDEGTSMMPTKAKAPAARKSGRAKGAAPTMTLAEAFAVLDLQSVPNEADLAAAVEVAEKREGADLGRVRDAREVVEAHEVGAVADEGKPAAAEEEEVDHGPDERVFPQEGENGVGFRARTGMLPGELPSVYRARVKRDGRKETEEERAAREAAMKEWYEARDRAKAEAEAKALEAKVAELARLNEEAKVVETFRAINEQDQENGKRWIVIGRFLHEATTGVPSKLYGEAVKRAGAEALLEIGNSVRSHAKWVWLRWNDGKPGTVEVDGKEVPSIMELSRLEEEAGRPAIRLGHPTHVYQRVSRAIKAQAPAAETSGGEGEGEGEAEGTEAVQAPAVDTLALVLLITGQAVRTADRQSIMERMFEGLEASDVRDVEAMVRASVGEDFAELMESEGGALARAAELREKREAARLEREERERAEAAAAKRAARKGAAAGQSRGGPGNRKKAA